MLDTAQIRRFGPFELDLRKRQLRKHGRRIKLQEQPFLVLSLLTERAGEVVTREEMRQSIWAEGTFVDFDNSLNVAVLKLRQTLSDDAAKPRYIETVPRRGYRFIGPLAEETAQAPAAVAVPLPPTEPVRRTRVLWWCLAGCAVAAATWVMYHWIAGRFVARPSIAVLAFQNGSGQSADDWVSTALEEGLSAVLAAGDRMRVISGDSVARARIELALPAASTYPKETLARIRRNLSADYAVSGVYAAEGGRWRLDLYIADLARANTIAHIGPRSADPDRLASVIEEEGIALRQKLGLRSLYPAETSQVRAGLPPNRKASELYAKGLDALRRFDARDARDLLSQAVVQAPDYPWARAALARAYAATDYGSLARDAAKRAWGLARNLGSADQLAIEARYHETAGAWDQAAQIYAQLWRRFPDSVDYGVRLARAQMEAGKTKPAIATVAALHQLPPPLGDNPAIDFTEALLAERQSDLTQEIRKAAQAEDKARERGEGLLVAEACWQQCSAQRDHGELTNAWDNCQTALRIYQGAHDQISAAKTIGMLAAVREDQGELTAARDLFNEALVIYRREGIESGTIWQLNGLADVLWNQGDAAGARRSYEEALQICKVTGDSAGQAAEMENLAFTWMLEGEREKARPLLEQARQIYNDLSDQGGVGSVLNNLGQLDYLGGDLKEAETNLNRALDIDQRTGAQAETADVLSWLGRLHLAEGDLEKARQDFGACLRKTGEMGSPGYTAKYGLRMAELEIEAGQPSLAEQHVRASLQKLEQQKQPDIQIEGHTLLARALLEEHKDSAAQGEIDRAAPLVKNCQNAAVRLAFAIAQARVGAAAGGPGVRQAVQSLTSAIAETERRGFLGYRLMAGLALGEIELRQGQTAGGRAHLQQVEREGRAHGFQAIANKAAAL